MTRPEPGGSAGERISPLGIAAVLTAVSLLNFLIDHNLWIALRFNDVVTAGSLVGSALDVIEEGSTRRRLAITLFGIFGFGMLVRRRTERLVLDPILVGVALAFVGWSGLSLGWADDFGFTLRRILAFWLLGIGAAGVVREVPHRSLPWYVLLSGSAFLAVGIVMEIYLGTFRPLAAGYRLAGTLHPNAQGVNCALTALAGIWLFLRGPERWRRVALVLGLLSLLGLVLTRSRTSFAAFLGACTILATLALRPGRRLVFATALTNALLMVGFLYVAGLLEKPLSFLMLGRELEGFATLSERVPLWEILSDYINQRPLLGYGYSGFMTPEHGAEVAVLLDFGVSSAHSVYLELLLGVGAVGLCLFVVFLTVAFLRTLAEQGPRARPAIAPLLGSVVIFETLNGMLDSSLVFPSWRITTLILFLALCVSARVGNDPGHGHRRPIGWTS